MHISLTPRALLRMLIVWGLTAFFIIGGIGNIFPFPTVREDYARWGYPDGFRYLIGLTEFAAALLITTERTRPVAAAIGGFVMASALLTLLVHAEFAHMAAPVTVLIALFVCLRLDAKAREIRWECKVF
jgi:hypothetical protein